MITTIVVVQLLIRAWFFASPWTAAHKASLSFTISRNLLKLMSIESVMPSNQLILCRPVLFQNFLQFIVIHTVKGFDIFNKVEVDVSLELSCFFDDPVDVGNLILTALSTVNL